MLRIIVPGEEFWNTKTEEFVYGKETVLQLEHSLVSISKWESRWNQAFLGKEKKTSEQLLDYIRCMTLTQNVDPRVYLRLTTDNISSIKAYIDSPMTATVFYSDDEKRQSRETVTSELIYYWMVAFAIPFECQKWHLNRLLTLIRICNIKNTPPKKRSQREIMQRNAKLNAQRRKRFGTRG